MKVKDFLEWFSDYDPESELKFELFELKDELRRCGVVETPLDAIDVNYSDKTDTVFVTMKWGD